MSTSQQTRECSLQQTRVICTPKQHKKRKSYFIRLYAQKMHSLGPSKQHTYWSRRPEAIFRMNVYEDKPSGPLSTLPIVRQVSQHIQQLEDLSIGYKDIMPEWVPSSKRLDNGEVCMDFKGTSYRSIGHLPGYSQLHPREVLLVSSLCMKPKQYLVSKKNIIMAAEESYKERLPFRPKQVQTLCHLDDAKASFLYHVFWNLGWLEPKDKSRATLEAAE